MNKALKKTLSTILTIIMIVTMVPIMAYAAADTSPYAPRMEANYSYDAAVIFANGTHITIEAAENGTAVWYMDGNTKKYVNPNGASGDDLSDYEVFAGSDNSDGMNCDGYITMTGGTVERIFAGQWYGALRGTSNITVTGGTLLNGISCDTKFMSGRGDRIVTVTIFDSTGAAITTDFGGKADNVVQKKGNNWTVSGNGVIPEGITVAVSQGETLTVPSGATLTNRGTLANIGGKLYIYGQLLGKGPENYIAPTNFVLNTETLKANVSTTLAEAVCTTSNTTLVPWFTYEIVNKGTTEAVLSGRTLTPYNEGTVQIKVTMQDGYCEPVSKTFDFPVSFTKVTDISGAVPTEAWVNTDVTLPNMDVTPEGASYQTVVWSVVNENGTGAAISGSKLKATNSGVATIRATVENGTAYGKAFTKDYTVNFKSSDTIDVSLGIVKITNKDSDTVTVNWIGFDGGSKDYAIDEPIYIRGAREERDPVITVASSCTIVLDNINIIGWPAIRIFNKGVTVHLNLVGTNVITCNAVSPSIQSYSENTLIIGGEGTLSANSGIGGDNWTQMGSVVVNSGTINGTIGAWGTGGAVVITGGSLSRAIHGPVTNGTENGSQALSKYTITLNGAGDGVSVADIDIPNYYSTNGVVTMNGGQIYLWLPADTMPNCITLADGTKYICKDGTNTYYTSHNWSEATCTNSAVCASCGASDGSVDPNNHISEETYLKYIDDTYHGLFHSCCQAESQREAHTPIEGQEATCVGVAVCADCGFAYGGNDTTNHISEELKYVSNGKETHILTHTCCGNPAAAPESHNMSYTVNGELTIDGKCEDCGDTGSVTLVPNVGGTYNGYEFVSEYSGTGILGGLDAFTKPVINGCCEDGCTDAGEHTVTMTLGGLSVSATFTVSPKELTISKIRAFFKVYDGNSVLGVNGIDMEGIVVYKEGDYPDAMWDDVCDDVRLNYENIVCTVDGTIPGTYETANVTGVALKGNDAHNYIIAESLENVPLIDNNGYAYKIGNPIIHLEALDQFLTGDAELDQSAYIIDGLDEIFTIEGVLLYENGSFVEVDTENVVIRLNGEDVTEYFDIFTYYGNLARVCEGHEFDENGFCSTGQCNSYEPAYKTVGTDEWGMEVEYYEIYNAGNLYWFAEQVNTYGNNYINGRLMADITVNEDLTAENLRQWMPIGGGYTPYVGIFDGQGYTVSGLYFEDAEATMVGLFGYTDYAYVIQNVHISNSYFKADSYVGALIGSSGSVVSGCTADSTVTVEGEAYRGGLIGYASGGEVTNSWSAVEVPEGAGGLVGYNCAAVTNCYTTANSLVGSNNYGGSVSDSYYLSDAETDDGGKTAEQFASGEVAYLLQSGVVAEDIYDEEGNYVESVTPHVWGQKIGTDDYPVLGGDKVYCVTNCNNENAYSNTNVGTIHIYLEPTFAWSEDYTACRAVFTCQFDTTHTETVDCTVAVDKSESSKTVYTATATLNGETYTDVKEVASKISKVTYTPSADTHNTFTVTVNGRPTMIQFIEEDGGTRTYDRNNKNVTITSYDADGNAVGSLDRTAAYEVWTINTNLIGPAVKLRAKYLEGTDYKWEKDTYNFTLEFAEPVFDTEIYESYLEPVTKKGPAKVVIITGADVQGIRFKMPNGTTTTYYADGAEVLEDGKLEFTGKVWMNESGENRIEIYVRSQNTWTYYGNFKHTVE